MKNDKVEIAGIILAAGRSERMGEANKLLALWKGKPLLRHCAEAALGSRLDQVAAVSGFEAEKVEKILPAEIALTRNADFSGGMAGSIRAGMYRLQGVKAVMILLGDMPMVEAAHINLLIDVFRAQDDPAAIVSAVESAGAEWGNPVLFGPAHFAALKELEGDKGGRSIMEENREKVREAEIGAAAFGDFDVPQSFDSV